MKKHKVRGLEWMIRHYFELDWERQRIVQLRTNKVDCPECGGESSNEDGMWCLFCGSTGLVDPEPMRTKIVNHRVGVLA